MSFKSALEPVVRDVNSALDNYLIIPNKPFDLIYHATRYSVLDAGKRLRAFMTVESGKLFNVSYDSCIRAGATIEMVHAFSLIHDDLPALDNDDIRRGKPSSHKKWGESTAILAGDALLNQAFYILSSDEKISPNPATRLELVRVLSECTGMMGMISGELMDLMAEDGKSFQTIADVDMIQFYKTGQIFTSTLLFGATLGNATDQQKNALKTYARTFGLAFQITDDILDVEGDPELVGKTLHKDAKSGKATYISIMGLEPARNTAKKLIDDAINALSIFDERADNLRELAKYTLTRKS